MTLPAPADLDGGELFGAPGGLIRPHPVVAIDGADVAGAPGVLASPVIVDGLSIVWGREELLDHPDPGTATVTLFDPTRTWATRRDVIGLPVTIRWAGVDPATGNPIGGVNFRGRVSAVQLRRHDVRAPGGGTAHGTLVTLTCTSVLLDLANRTPTDAWPEETLGARRARLAAACAPVVANVYTRPAWNPAMLAAVPADRQVSLLDHLRALYTACGGDRMTHLLDQNAIGYVVRPDFDNQRAMAQLWWHTTGETAGSARAGLGVFARIMPGLVAVGETLPTGPRYLDAADLEYAEGLGRTAAARISRVEVSHPSSTTNAERTVTRLVPGVDELVTGVRALRVDVDHRWDSWADLVASDLTEVVAEEAAYWRPDVLRWSTRKTGGFADTDQATWLLRGFELPTPGFVQRSELSTLRVRPIYQLVGGVIGYARGGWDLDLTLGAISTPLPQHPISFEELTNGAVGFEVQAHDAPHPQGLHPSLTFEDLLYVGRGLAVGATPVDQGWDFRP